MESFFRNYEGKEKLAKAVEAAQKIQSMYSSGTPLFKKDIFRECAGQIDAFRRGYDVTPTITGIDGTIVKAAQPLSWPAVKPLPGEGSDSIPVAITLRYKSLQYIATSLHLQARDLNNAYLSATISFVHVERDTCAKISSPLHQGLDLKQVLDKELQKWRNSHMLGEFQSALSQLAVPSNKLKIQKITAFGLGPMAWDGQPNPYSVLQHALLLSLRTLLASPAGDKSKLECFAQDPLYTDQDKLALADSGIVVLDEPKGFLEVDDFTIVLSIGPDVPVKQIIADISRPAVIIRDEHEDTTPSDAAILRTTPDLHEFWRCFRATIRGLGSRSARNSGYWEFTSEIRVESK